MNKQILQTICILSLISIAFGCSSLLVTPDAAKAGNSIMYYSADSWTLHGTIKSLPASDYPAGTMQQIHDWDSGVYLGEIPQVSHTYNVIANINEHGLSIGETTYGGLEILCKPNGIMDYGTLIWTTLQRAQTAREAIQIMVNLTNEYGYYSEGESFSIADKNELFVLEMIGKGEFEKGTVWVAKRVPDGHISAHANQARITTFDRNSSDVYYSEDVVSFAIKYGLYQGSDEDFSFSDTYAPLDAFQARMCETRVWTMFGYFKDMSPWLDFVQGKNLSNKMPWSIPIGDDQKISLNDTFWITRNHNEGSWFDDTQDIGAGPFNAPYRQAFAWQYEGIKYVSERPISIQQTGWNFASEIRRNVPKEISGVTWFAMDDSCCGVKVPIYASSTQAPLTWGIPNDGTKSGNVMNFNFDHNWWITNLLTNFAYDRWSEIYPEITKEMVILEERGFQLSQQLDQVATEYINNNQIEEALEHIKRVTNHHADSMTARWKEMYGYIFAKYRDGGVRVSAPLDEEPGCACSQSNEGYNADGDAWYARIANETGDHYLMFEYENPQMNSLLKRNHGVKQ